MGMGSGACMGMGSGACMGMGSGACIGMGLCMLWKIYISKVLKNC